MKKCVIYTCIIGAYDDLLQPAVTDQDFDFVCFVGKGEKTAERIGVWEIREFDCGLEYVDGNIELLDGSIYEAARSKMASGVLYSGVPHPDRDSMYEEVSACRKAHHINHFDRLRIWLWLWLHGVPYRSGLMENNLIFRRHLDPAVVRLDELWWSKLFSVSFRDQLSFMWCLHKCGIPVDFFLPDGMNTRNHPGFRYLLHK